MTSATARHAIGQRRGWWRRFGVALLAMSIGVGLPALLSSPASAADTTAAMTINKTATSTSPQPGEKFSYIIAVQCTAATVSGCIDAAVTDPLPDGLTVADRITVSGANTPPSITPADPTDDFTVSFQAGLGGGDTGLTAGVAVTITVPVRLDPDYPPSKSGQPLDNTATISADNAAAKDSTATVTPVVPPKLAAETSKDIEQLGALPDPGTAANATITGTSTSNMPVDTLVISDPVDPTADPNPFSYLALTGLGDITMPDGADAVRVRAYVNGAWVDGPLGPPAALPDGVDPADVRGLQFVFSNTAGDGIVPGAKATVDLNLAQTDAVTDAPKPLVVGNTARTTVTLGELSASSDPATDTYRIPPADVRVGATKTFEPDTVRAGDPSTATLTATNLTQNTIDSLTITEPAEGANNPFDHGLAFTGLGSDGAGAGIVWPRGATGASIIYSCDGIPAPPRTTSNPDTLPDPPAGCGRVNGFTVTFTGAIVQGAEATIPVGVVTNAGQTADEVTRTNTIGVTGTLQSLTGDATATDQILSINPRLAVEVGKKISPAQIPSRPGQIAVSQLTGHVLDFPDSTTDAHQIIVQDPDPLGGNTWFDAFRPESVVATAVPADATLTVQYWDGSAWETVPGMASLAGPTIVNEDLPDAVRDTAQGLRFVYTSTLDAPDGFAPGTSVAPNFTSSLRSSMGGSDDTITNCAGALAASGAVTAEADPTACDDIELIPTDPGTVDPIDKTWDKNLLNARSEQRSGVSISWSTQGYTGLQTVSVSDTANPDETPLTDSVYDTFDLVRIDPITASMDPHLIFDRVTAVQLFRLPAGSTDPATASWQDAVNDPCPSACDGTFPGVTLTADERADTIGFRLVYAESPTRAQQLSKPTDPPVGTGVAPSMGNDRHIHPVFQLRDELRSDPDVPVTADRTYNIAGKAGQIRNTARMTGIFDDNTVMTGTDGDDIGLVDVPVTTHAAKAWTGGPMGRPADTVPADEYPTGRVTMSGKNTTPAKVDTLTITDPVNGTDPFEEFNLVGFTAITTPASIGADSLQIILDGSAGVCTPASPCSRADALALSEAELPGVTGMTLTYTGRIDAGATATATFDVRLRPMLRSDPATTTPTGSFDNAVGVQAADLANYPDVTPRTADDTATATMVVRPSGIDVHAAKSVDPSTITEPSHGPTTVTLQGQPDGVSRTVEMVLTDTAPTFFNAYDLDALSPVILTAPIDRVRVDAYVGGTWSLDGDGNPAVTGGHWVSGDPVAGPAVALPDGVNPADVQGLRYTFTRADGANWENPQHPIQKVQFTASRRDTLHTGGPVPSDLAGSTPAPGETVAGDTTNTVVADVTSSDTDGNGDPLTGDDSADSTIHYAHAHNAVRVRKGPNSQQNPGRPFTYTLQVTNTGDVPISNPVITDLLPADGDGPMVVYPEVTGDRFGYATSDGSGMPTGPADVTVERSDTGLRFTFPAGTTLAIGGSYTITFDMQTRPGLPANTPFTNTFGITGDRPWDGCDGVLDDETGQCRASATNTVLSAGALSVAKRVKAEGSDDLGTTHDPLITPTDDCTAGPDGFYTRPCIPIAKPGGAITWRFHFLNTGNRPIDRIVAVDRLPAPDDALATAPDLARGSQWRPLLDGVRPTIAHGTGTLNVWYTTADTPCTLDLGTDATRCPDGSWQEWPAGQTLPVDANTVTGIKVEILLPDENLAPAATLDVDVTMTAPAFSPTAGADTMAFNTVGMSGRWVSSDRTGYTLTTEPARVGVALATGPLQVVKKVDGDAAAQYAPDSFDATLSCTSVGQPVLLTDGQKNLTLQPGQPVTVQDLPYLSRCTVSEGDHGQTSTDATTATVQREITDVQTVTLTNTYDYASLAIGKTVDSSAVDADGVPVSYGPFTVAVSCTFLGGQIYADGFDADTPMTADLADGDTVTFTHLPAGARCTVTETDTKGAVSTAIVSTAGDADPVSTDGTDATIDLAADPRPYTGTDPANSATITNHFDAGTLSLTKVVSGDAAPTYGAGPFTLHVACTLDDESGSRSVYDGDVVLDVDSGLRRSIDNLATGAECTVTEPDDGGASATTMDPAGPVTIGGSADDPVAVTVTNNFDPGTLLLTKTVTGDAAGFAPDSFDVQVTCSANGAVLPGFPRTVTVAPGTPTEVDTLVGATCSALETGAGGATETAYDPAGDGSDQGSAAVEIPAAGSDPVTPPEARIAVTNTYRAGALQISKLIDGPGAALGTGPYTFAVACAFDGDDTAYTDTVTLARSGAESQLTSDEIGPLPVGALCTVTETDSAGADAVPEPVTVTIPDVDRDGARQVAVAELVNDYSAATLQVHKVVDGDGASRADGTVFTVDVTCQVEGPDGVRATVYTGSVRVTGGATVPVLEADGDPALLPLGAHCWAAEPDAGGADATTIDHDSWDAAVVVRQSDDAQVLTITVTNTFGAPPTTGSSPAPTTPTAPTTGPTGDSTSPSVEPSGTSAVTSPPTVNPSRSTGGSMPDTGVPILRQVLLGLALLLGGAALMLLLRRRRGAH